MSANYDYECGTCGKTFAAGRQARDNHCRSTGHSPAQHDEYFSSDDDNECGTCGKVFTAGRQALDNHCHSTGHSPAQYDDEYYSSDDDNDCGTCGKVFTAGRQALDNHCRSTGHWPAHDESGYDSADDDECGTCDKVFTAGRQALDNHCRSTGHWPAREASECYSSSDAESFDDEDLECRHERYCYQNWRTAADRVQHEAIEHNFCGDCDQYFNDYNSVKMHLNSRKHRGQNIPCPFCQATYVTATGLTHHLESGTCPNASGLSRDTVYRFVRAKDPNGAISKKLIGWTGSRQYKATARAWNGASYECYICHRSFSALHGLNQHLGSPVHQQALYHCPKVSCRMDFKSLAGLMNHLESEACGCTRFEHVQSQIGNVVSGNRLISF